ncbi:nucleolar protein 58-like [Centruroides sculpturatus]|uniref:nucleolar protein 58-like n=1 Tax=Centruroides sculpturatus TaxID=218467 RepID=UPI000C6DFC8D|nr:nucleolar protein 58-like [Centruroides sculpturatus]
MRRTFMRRSKMLVLFESPAGCAIFKDKLDINCVSNSNVQELMRCIRSKMDSLISGIPSSEMAKMTLCFTYRLKFNPDEGDTMIIQAICKYSLTIIQIIINYLFYFK